MEIIDPQLQKIYENELNRQRNTLSLIPSENYVSNNVLWGIGSIFTNKYSEGEPGKRYYQGNKNVDDVEYFVNNKVYQAFDIEENSWHVNVKAVSESVANLAILNAVLDLGDKIMSMYLFDGGHLSHGWKLPSGKKITISSKFYDTVQYHVDPITQVIDYDKVEELARKEKPKLLITGGTGYPRNIDYERMASIAKSCGAMYFADVSHEAGLIVGNAHPNPFPYADIVSMSTQKTLRGPRASIIICRNEYKDIINRSLFPGIQGGPFDHHIFSLGVCLAEALTEDFKSYANQTVKNSQALADKLISLGHSLVANGTDKHLFLLDLSSSDMSGKEFAVLMEEIGLVANYNTIPFDKRTPFNPSGVRMGTPGITSRGMKEKDSESIALIIHNLILNSGNENKKQEMRNSVLSLCREFPLWY